MFCRPTFPVAGPTVWNSLPSSFRDSTRSFDSFQLDYYTFFRLSLLKYGANYERCEYVPDEIITR